MEKTLEKKLRKPLMPGKIRISTTEEFDELFPNPKNNLEAQKIFDYTHRWVCDSRNSDFIFDEYSTAA